MQRPLSFRKGFDALETLTIWAWALTRMGQEHGHLSSPEWDHASRASLPAPQPCPLLLASPLQAGSVLSTQPLLRSQFSAQWKCFLCAHFSRWPPTLAWIEKHRNQTADRRLPWQCLIGTQACKLTPALLTLPHHLPSLILSLELVQVPELSLLLPTDHPLSTCPRCLFVVGVQEIGIQ